MLKLIVNRLADATRSGPVRFRPGSGRARPLSAEGVEGASPVESSELRIQQHQLRDVPVERLQLHRVRLVARRVPASVPQVERVLQVFVLRVVQVGEEPAEQNQVRVSGLLHIGVAGEEVVLREGPEHQALVGLHPREFGVERRNSKRRQLLLNFEGDGAPGHDDGRPNALLLRALD